MTLLDPVHEGDPLVAASMRPRRRSTHGLTARAIRIARRAFENRLVQFGAVAAALFAIAPPAAAPSRIDLHHEALSRLQAAEAERAGVTVLPGHKAREVDTRAV